jgi:hypothetical protein
MLRAVNLNTEEFFMDEAIKELNSVNKKLAKLALRKEDLIKDIIAGFGHKKEGQTTYEHGVWKVEVKTPFTYTLDKKKYESGKYKLPEKYNPIKESVSYSLDKRLCEEYVQNAPPTVKKTLIELVEKKPGKPNVVIKERI